MDTATDTRPADLKGRTYHCGRCGAVMLRAAAELREGEPHCSICGDPLATGEPTEPIPVAS